MKHKNVIHTGTLSERVWFSKPLSLHVVRYDEMNEARDLIDGNLCQWTMINGKKELQTL